MTIPTSLARAAERALTTISPELSNPAAMRGRNRPQLRRYEVSTLLPSGSVAETRHLAPALSIFEDAFCAFSRGAMIETAEGPIAVEDLLPGDRIVDIDGEEQPLLWKGSTTVIPGRPGPQGRSLKLTRIMADSFGMQRPLTCLVAGPSARILHTPDHLRAVTGGVQTLTPIEEFTDGINVIETAPPTPVQLFHICLARHAVIRVGGLEFETYHPGETAGRLLSPSMRSVFLNLFEHADTFRDFGPLAYMRSSDDDGEALSA